jgi:hypothetical protein
MDRRRNADHRVSHAVGRVGKRGGEDHLTPPEPASDPLSALDERGIRTRREEAGAVCGKHDEPEQSDQQGVPVEQVKQRITVSVNCQRSTVT